MNQKIVCQGPTWSSRPPTTGAIAGATLKISITRLIRRCASAPSNTSRMTVRLTITPPPTKRPWSTRHARSTGSDGASAQPTDAAAYATRPPSITGRRPTASDSGPQNGLIRPKETRYAETTSCICALVTSRSCAISRNAGKGVSMLNGPSIDIAARIAGTRNANPAGSEARSGTVLDITTQPVTAAQGGVAREMTLTRPKVSGGSA